MNEEDLLEAMRGIVRDENSHILYPSVIRDIGKAVSAEDDEDKAALAGKLMEMTPWEAYNAGVYQMGETIISRLLDRPAQRPVGDQ